LIILIIKKTNFILRFKCGLHIDRVLLRKPRTKADACHWRIKANVLCSWYVYELLSSINQTQDGIDYGVRLRVSRWISKEPTMNTALRASLRNRVRTRQMPKDVYYSFRMLRVLECRMKQHDHDKWWHIIYYYYNILLF